jgi:bifunctional DNA-binding transcriptional regulator/antitoxin component of YhaV-PrlF toxin-antitoxin module
MASVTIKYGTELILPPDVRDRYGLTADTSVRIIETRSGILLIPLTEEPMSPQLAQELEEWQALGAEAWELIPYEDSEA